MKARPILFKPDMVQALLAGRKTMTRRVVKQAEQFRDWRHVQLLTPQDFGKSFPGADSSSWMFQREKGPLVDLEFQPISCPYGAPGDVLWVRETIRLLGGHHSVLAGNPQSGRDVAYAEYAADGAPVPLDAWPWEKDYLSSIHLPLGLSRLTLEITNVRVERLKDISEDDARAEGAQHFAALPGSHPYGQDARWSMEQPDSVEQCLGSARMAFANYFCKINGSAPKGRHDPAPWDANPWVWVVEFQPHHMNVDAFLRDREVA